MEIDTCHEVYVALLDLHQGVKYQYPTERVLMQGEIDAPTGSGSRVHLLFRIRRLLVLYGRAIIIMRHILLPPDSGGDELN